MSRLEDYLKTQNPACAEGVRILMEWAKDVWRKPLDPYCIDHGISHSEHILNYVEDILYGATNNDIGSLKLEPHDYFLFLSAAYLHDIGMQEGFRGFLSSELADSVNLDANDFERIRLRHSEIGAGVVCSALKSEDQFPPVVKASLSRLDGASARIISTLFQNSANDLHSIIKFHRNTANLGLQAAFFQRKSEFKDLGTRNRITTVTALLQLGDCLDMTRERVAEDIFLAQLAEIEKDITTKTLTEDMNSRLRAIEKKLFCYAVDKVDIKFISSRTCQIQLMTTIPDATNDAHTRFVNRCHDAYSHRTANRPGTSCTSTIANDLKIEIQCICPRIDTSKSKVPFPSAILNYLEKQCSVNHDTPIQGILDSVADRIARMTGGYYIWIKRYSVSGRFLYDGGADASWNSREVIRQAILWPREWGMIVSKGSRPFSDILSFFYARSLLMQKKYGREICRSWRKRHACFLSASPEVTSAFYLAKSYSNAPRGVCWVVNVHFRDKMSEKALRASASMLDRELHQDILRIMDQENKEDSLVFAAITRLISLRKLDKEAEEHFSSLKKSRSGVLGRTFAKMKLSTLMPDMLKTDVPENEPLCFVHVKSLSICLNGIFPILSTFANISIRVFSQASHVVVRISPTLQYDFQYRNFASFLDACKRFVESGGMLPEPDDTELVEVLVPLKYCIHHHGGRLSMTLQDSENWHDDKHERRKKHRPACHLDMILPIASLWK